MGRQVEVRCRCGQVGGVVTDPSPHTVNRMVCYCDDCQAYAHQIGRADLLNDRGGSDVIQIAPAALRFTKGQDRIEGLRLTPKGLYRWYAKCCNTPGTQVYLNTSRDSEASQVTVILGTASCRASG